MMKLAFDSIRPPLGLLAPIATLRRVRGLALAICLAAASLHGNAPATTTASADTAAMYRSTTPRPVADTFFGITVNKLGVHRAWPGLNTRVIRMWDTGTRWMDIEPARGRWNFRRADLYVDYAERNGAQVLFTLGQTPAWAASDRGARCTYGTGCSPPASLQDWRKYVRALATRYGSRVRYYELWNEPDHGGFWRGSPEQLATMARIAREEIVRTNPQAELIGPAVTFRGLEFLDRFLAAPGGDAIGAISFHMYANASLAGLTAMMRDVRAIAAAHGRSEIPLWNTEFGVSCRRSPADCDGRASSSMRAIQRVAAALFVMAAEGLQNADFYTWERRPPVSPFNLTSPPGFASLSPAGQIYAAAASLLSGATITESYDNDGLVVVRFSNGGKSYVALWSEDKAIPLRPPADWPFMRYDRLGGGELMLTRDGYFELPEATVVIGSI